MNIEVRYFSRTGNTKKLAEALSESLNVKAKSIEEPVEGPIDILFLGNSVYSSNVASEVKKFIKNLNVPVSQVVNFGSSATGKTTDKKIKKLFSKKGIPVSEDSFFVKGRYKVYSRGGTSIINHDKPDQEDLLNIKRFGERIVTNTKI